LNPMYFDNSVFDFYLALFTGASLTPFPRSMLTDARTVVQEVERAECSVWFSVPSMLVYMLAMKAIKKDVMPNLRLMVFGGEGFPKGRLQKLKSMLAPTVKLVNVYGPTECTCICSAYDVRQEDFTSLEGLLPLGRINPNTGFHVLDEEGKRAKTGQVGELCLTGPSVGCGYYSDPAQTAAAFGDSGFAKGLAEPMYRTGDLVRCEGDGMLWFVGRKDNQIKHQGYRIELEEIESALNLLDSVNEAAVVYLTDHREQGHITAFVGASGALDPAALKEQLRRSIPAYMIPRAISVLKTLPKNQNGKIDRNKLKATTARVE
jgi:acyl-coenzyme A synthetase/AMP-(fatty) acid ligase